jgi:hypothetical protein
MSSSRSVIIWHTRVYFVVCIVVWCAALCISEYDDASPALAINPAMHGRYRNVWNRVEKAMLGFSVNGSMVDAASWYERSLNKLDVRLRYFICLSKLVSRQNFAFCSSTSNLFRSILNLLIFLSHIPRKYGWRWRHLRRRSKRYLCEVCNSHWINQSVKDPSERFIDRIFKCTLTG